MVLSLIGCLVLIPFVVGWTNLKKMGHFRPLFLYFRLFDTVDSKQMFNKFCQWLDLNRGPLVSEATALPTEPQPLPVWTNLCLHIIAYSKFLALTHRQANAVIRLLDTAALLPTVSRAKWLLHCFGPLSVWPEKKLPNVYKSCLKMISLEKW